MLPLVNSRTNSDVRFGLVILAGAALCGILLLLRETASAAVVTWYSSNAYNHGFLIVPICLYLGWRQRSELMAAVAAPDWRGMVLVVLAVLVWLAGHVTGTLVIQEFALVAIIQSVAFAVFGWEVLRALAFPLIYLYFAVPFGDSLEPRLQAITASLAIDLLRLAGVPVFGDGNLISIPTGNFNVAEECSGLRFLIASLAMGALFANLMYRSWWRRIFFLALCFVVPIFANGARAFGIIYLAYNTNNRLAIGVDHIVYGWVFFSLITLLLLALGNTFREVPDGPVAPQQMLGSVSTVPLRRFIIASAIVVGVVFAATLFGTYLDRVPSGTLASLRAPDVTGAWRAVPGARDPAPPVFASPDTQFDSAYEDGTSRVYLHIGYYLYDRRGAQAVSSAHDFEGQSPWSMAGSGNVSVTVDGQPITVQYLRSVRGTEGHIVWHWYWVDGRFTGNPYLGKLLALKAVLLGGRRASAVVAVSAGYKDRPAEAEDALRRFVGNLRGLGAVLEAATAQ